MQRIPQSRAGIGWFSIALCFLLAALPARVANAQAAGGSIADAIRRLPESPYNSLLLAKLNEVDAKVRARASKPDKAVINAEIDALKAKSDAWRKSIFRPEGVELTKPTVSHMSEFATLAGRYGADAEPLAWDLLEFYIAVSSFEPESNGPFRHAIFTICSDLTARAGDWEQEFVEKKYETFQWAVNKRLRSLPTADRDEMFEDLLLGYAARLEPYRPHPQTQPHYEYWLLGGVLTCLGGILFLLWWSPARVLDVDVQLGRVSVGSMCVAFSQAIPVLAFLERFGGLPIGMQCLTSIPARSNRVIDAWIDRHLPYARQQLLQVPILRERPIWVEVDAHVNKGDGQNQAMLDKDALKDWLRDGSALLIVGEPDSGKTSLACDIARRVIGRNDMPVSDNGAPKPTASPAPTSSAANELCDRCILPLVLPGDLAVEEDRFDQLIRNALGTLIGRPSVPAQLVKRLMTRRRLVLIFDGIDQHEETIGKIRRTWISQEVPIIITARGQVDYAGWVVTVRPVDKPFPFMRTYIDQVLARQKKKTPRPSDTAIRRVLAAMTARDDATYTAIDLIDAADWLIRHADLETDLEARIRVKFKTPAAAPSNAPMPGAAAVTTTAAPSPAAVATPASPDPAS